jgi:hypothetical protein
MDIYNIAEGFNPLFFHLFIKNSPLPGSVGTLGAVEKGIDFNVTRNAFMKKT